MAFADAAVASDKTRRTISVSSGGPSAVVVPVQSKKIKRANRDHAKKVNNARVLNQLPFAE